MVRGGCDSYGEMCATFGDVNVYIYLWIVFNL